MTVANDDGAVSRHDVSNEKGDGAPIAVCRGVVSGSITSLAVDASGTVAVVGGEDKSLSAVPLSGMREPFLPIEVQADVPNQSYSGHWGAVSAVAFDAATRCVSVGGGDAVYVWDVDARAGKALAASKPRDHVSFAEPTSEDTAPIRTAPIPTTVQFRRYPTVQIPAMISKKSLLGRQQTRSRTNPSSRRPRRRFRPGVSSRNTRRARQSRRSRRTAGTEARRPPRSKGQTLRQTTTPRLRTNHRRSGDRSRTCPWRSSSQRTGPPKKNRHPGTTRPSRSKRSPNPCSSAPPRLRNLSPSDPRASSASPPAHPPRVTKPPRAPPPSPPRQPPHPRCTSQSSVRCVHLNLCNSYGRLD